MAKWTESESGLCLHGTSYGIPRYCAVLLDSQDDGFVSRHNSQDVTRLPTPYWETGSSPKRDMRLPPYPMRILRTATGVKNREQGINET